MSLLFDVSMSLSASIEREETNYASEGNASACVCAIRRRPRSHVWANATCGDTFEPVQDLTDEKLVRANSTSSVSFPSSLAKNFLSELSSRRKRVKCGSPKVSTYSMHPYTKTRECAVPTSYPGAAPMDITAERGILSSTPGGR